MSNNNGDQYRNDCDELRQEIRRWALTSTRAIPFGNWIESQLSRDMPYYDIRRISDEEDRWLWLIPDFDVGRTRVVAVTGEVLRGDEAEAIQAVLDAANWRERIRHQDLLVAHDDSGELNVSHWEPDVDDAWFPDPAGGFYCAYLETRRTMRANAPFLALVGRNWSARGPESTKPPRSFTEEELRPYLPRRP